MGCCEDYLTCDIAYNAVMPLSRALTRGRYSRIVGVTKMEENSSVGEHILRMSGYHNHLTQLGVNLPVDSVIDRVFQSLPPTYKSFAMNYNMQGMDKKIPELFAIVGVQK